ncbi:MAG: M48 family metallopeptidase [Bacteroidales bacterium]|jgi:predicted Zn-dependent protease|nr:M48 family metallopeptidase [Bacteroidales bacterium]MDD2824743.1 M48 family metallopeptidase [Bacteroidales bacterium]MDD3100531.1 M48 family metallopeptidase [Bacteroidales bacterium]MDD3639454.1 M48 family metallopeptidase [Bacteroidales bacterium]MDD3944132.1 M48 family metallopeptidase [Bacteroidales bacterium]
MKKNAILSLLVLIVLHACGTTAFTGRKQLLVYSDESVSALSDESYADFMKTAVVSDDVMHKNMVRSVGERMVIALTTYLQGIGRPDYLTGLDWDFQLIDDPAVNAFCLPNGKIVLFEGILNFADNPNHLAIVIGHEMGHAVARHGNERMSQQALLQSAGQIATQVFSQTKYGGTAQAVELFAQAFAFGSNVGVVLPFSRKHEYEADRIGLYIMALAGYDIYQTPLFWEKMMADQKSPSFDFLSTHPADVKRIAAISESLDEAATYYRDPGAGNINLTR